MEISAFSKQKMVMLVVSFLQNIHGSCRRKDKGARIQFRLFPRRNPPTLPPREPPAAHKGWPPCQALHGEGKRPCVFLRRSLLTRMRTFYTPTGRRGRKTLDFIVTLHVSLTISNASLGCSSCRPLEGHGMRYLPPSIEHTTHTNPQPTEHADRGFRDVPVVDLYVTPLST